MATKNKPGAFDCYANAAPDEPMFVLLGRDPMAPALVDLWAALREAAGEDPAKVAEARACATAMRQHAADLAKGGRLDRIDYAVLGEPEGPFVRLLRRFREYERWAEIRHADVARGAYPSPSPVERAAAFAAEMSASPKSTK